MKLLTCLVASSLLLAPAFAADVLRYAPPDDPLVPARVLAYHRSVHTPDWSSRPRVCINPDVSALEAAGVPQRFWRCTTDDCHHCVIREMTQAERDALDPGPQEPSQEPQEPCTRFIRGSLNLRFMGPGQDDRLMICAKDSANTFRWRLVSWSTPAP